MREFSAQDVLKPRWDPSLKDRAVRRFAMVGLALAVLVIVGRVATGVLGVSGHPLAVWGAFLIPLGASAAAITAALVIRFSGAVGSMLKRTALGVFLGALTSIVLVVWVHALLFELVDSIAANQTAAQASSPTWFSGELTIEEIQGRFLPLSERTLNQKAYEGDEVIPHPPGQGRWSFLAYPLWPLQFRLVRDLLVAGGLLGFVSAMASFAIWWERKVAGRIQSRLGPMRVGGWHGWAQSVADGLKLVQKEDITPDHADKPLFKIAPYLVFVPIVAAFIALPFGAGWVGRDLDVALIFILAMVGIDVVGVIIGGWASNNKWSVYGAMREACQIVSYEIPMGMALLIPVMMAGTLNLTEIGARQAGGFASWLAFANPFTFVAAVTYFIASLASCKRAPFDLPEAESELVAGFHTEYSGFRWAVFFFGEYAGIFIVSGLAVILFFGAWNSPLPSAWGAGLAEGALWRRALHGVLFSGPIWFLAKSFFFVYVQIWLRWTLPRVRIDQVMYACVQVLLPLAMVVLLGNTLWSLLVPTGGLIARAANALMTLIGAGIVLGFVAIMLYGFTNRRRLLGRLAVDHLPGS